jgi:hypothetical protein
MIKESNGRITYLPGRTGRVREKVSPFFRCYLIRLEMELYIKDKVV